MAVFSYTSQPTNIGSEEAQQIPAPSLVHINSKNIQEEVVYSYNDSSAVYLIDEDFGSITESPTIDDDYGSILENDIVGARYQDYGLISINETIVPYGTIDIGDDSFAQLKLIKVDVGKVTLTILGEAYIFTTPIEFGSGTFKFHGTASPVVIKLSHFGSGQFSILSGSAEVVGVKYPESTTLFRITGSALEKLSVPYIGSGSLFTFVTFTETVSLAKESQGLFRITGSATPIIVGLSHIGSGSLFGFSSTTEALGSNPPESTVLFRFTDTADYQFFVNNTQTTEGSLTLRGESEILITKAQEGKVLLEISGSATESFAPAPYVGEGLITTKLVEVLPGVISDYSDVQISALADTQISELVTVITLPVSTATVSATYNPPEEGTLFTLSDTALEKTADSYVGSGNLKFVRDSATTIFRLGHIGSVKFDIEGAVQESITPAPHVGTGTLFTFTGSSESVTVDPVDKTTLFTFAGSAVERASNIYDGSVTLSVGDSSVTKFNLLHVGSGSLFGFSSTTESLVVNPPESTALFRITGKLRESISPAPHIGTGSLFTFISFTESTTSAERTKGLFKVSGRAIEKNTESYKGSGTLFGFSSTTEAVGSNPPESTALFRFTGTAVEKSTDSYVGSGSLFTVISSTEVSGVSERSQGLFKFTGSAVEKNTESYLGSGTLFNFTGATEAVSNAERAKGVFRFTGSAVEKNTESYVGTGTLFGFSSTTEAIGSNPPESIALFKISGSATESIAPAPHVGSGSIFTFISATETRAISEVATGRFKFSGSAVEKNTESYLGSGTLFNFTGATEAISNVEKAKGIFKFTGSAVEKNTESYVGTGILFGFSSTTESVGSNPPESIALFKISGSATESIAPAPHVGSGSIFTFISATETRAISEVATGRFKFSGSAVEKNTESYLGTGTLFGFSSTTEAIGSNPPESTALFRFTGSATESIAPAPHVGSGSIFTFISFTESIAISPDDTKVLFTFVGESTNKKTDSYRGTGSLFAITGSYESTLVIAQLTGVLFGIFGRAFESYGYANYDGIGLSQMEGLATTSRVEFEPAKPIRIMMI